MKLIIEGTEKLIIEGTEKEIVDFVLGIQSQQALSNIENQASKNNTCDKNIVLFKSDGWIGGTITP